MHRTRTAWTPPGRSLPGTIDATLYEPLAEVIPLASRRRSGPPRPRGGGGGRVIRLRLRREARAA